VSRGVRLTGHRLIRAPVQRVWHLLSRPEIHPRYTKMWMAADVLERSQTGALVEFRGFFGGLPIVSVQRLTLKPPWRLEFRQVRGELRDLSGAYVLKDVEGETDLSCDIVVDAGIALFSDTAVEQILAGHTEGTLGRIKTTAERDLVRIGRRSRPGAAAARAGEPRDADEGAEDETALPSAGPLSDAAPAAAPADDDEEEDAPVASQPDGGQAIRADAAPSPGRPGQPGEPRRRRRRRRGRRRPGSGAPPAGR
jgi:uncharacterized protein YndB with AHSA1/START domain